MVIKVSDTCVENILKVEIPRQPPLNVEANKFFDWIDDNMEENSFDALDGTKTINLLSNNNLLYHFVFNDSIALVAFKLRWL